MKLLCEALLLQSFSRFAKTEFKKKCLFLSFPVFFHKNQLFEVFFLSRLFLASLGPPRGGAFFTISLTVLATLRRADLVRRAALTLRHVLTLERRHSFFGSLELAFISHGYCSLRSGLRGAAHFLRSAYPYSLRSVGLILCAGLRWRFAMSCC